MKIDLIYRVNRVGIYSIENVFNCLIEYLKNNNDLKKVIMPNKTSYFGRLLYILIKKRRNAICHITGDEHYLLLFLNRSKAILTIHDINHYENDLKGLKKVMYRLFWLEIPIRKAKIVTTISNHTKQKLLDNFKINPKRIAVVYNPLCPAFYERTKLFSSDLPNILCIGTAENKNLNRLIIAIENITCTLTIVGKISNNIFLDLKRRNIRYINYTNVSNEELIEIYYKSDIVSFISLEEGFGLPIIEAQAIGRPVITSSISSMPEVAGEGALLVNPFIISEIRNAILRIINEADLREKLIEAGRVNIKRFRPEIIAEEYMKLYKRLDVL